MKIRDFLRENKLSVGDNVSLLLEKLSIKDGRILNILEAEIGEKAKMSKSKGNVVDPETAVEKYGADTVRLYILFAAPPQQDFEWSEEGIQGVHRFLNRLWNFVTAQEEKFKEIHYTQRELRKVKVKAKEFRRKTHSILKNYIESVEQDFGFNTAVADIMKLFNELSAFIPSNPEEKKVFKESLDILLKMLFPFAPHIAEELWYRIGHKTLLAESGFPEVDPEALKVEELEIPVQVNGKLRGRIKIPYDASEETAKEKALQLERVKSLLKEKKPKRVIYVKNKLINIVV